MTAPNAAPEFVADLDGDLVNTAAISFVRAHSDDGQRWAAVAYGLDGILRLGVLAEGAAKADVQKDAAKLLTPGGKP